MIPQKLTPEKVREAQSLRDKGVSVAAVAFEFDVAETTLRRYLRAYNRYGESYWTTYPEEVNDRSAW